LRADPEPEMGDDEAFVRRNLIYLIRHVSRQGDDGLDEEIAVLARHAAPAYPSMVVKEAIGAIAQYPGRRAEQALLAIKERMLAAPTGGAGKRPRSEDLRTYLDRLASALARRETSPRAPGRPSSGVSNTQKFPLAADALPGLLYELSESKSYGSLSLEDGGGVASTLAFSGGRLVSARAGAISGAEAVYQVLQVFSGGNAAWAPYAPSRGTPLFEADSLAPGPLVVEGVRRRDERELARAFAPDGAVLAAGKSAPRPHPDEKDGLVTRDVWAAVTAGRPPLEIEKALPVEAFRVRRLLLHWVEEGALQEVFSVSRSSGA